MDTSCMLGCFDLPISEVLQDQHLGILGNQVCNVGNIYCQDEILPSFTKVSIPSRMSLGLIIESWPALSIKLLLTCLVI